jgi:hypothetical protein
MCAFDRYILISIPGCHFERSGTPVRSASTSYNSILFRSALSNSSSFWVLSSADCHVCILFPCSPASPPLQVLFTCVVCQLPVCAGPALLPHHRDLRATACADRPVRFRVQHGMERRREPVSPTSPFPSSAKLPPWYYPTVSIRSAELRSDRLTFMPLHACEHYLGPACLMPRSCSMPKGRCTWWTVGLPAVFHPTHVYLPSNLLIGNHILNMLGHADRTNASPFHRCRSRSTISISVQSRW